MSSGAVSPTWVFVRLKYRLVINGVRRMTRSKWSRLGFVLSLLGAAGAAVLGLVVAVGLRSHWTLAEQHRVLVLATTAIVFGWWFGPVLSGGVDETIDPARLSLIPLSRSEIRRGQIAAGFVGITPLMVVTWVVGIVIGMSRSWSVVPLLALCGVVVLLAALVGSRSLSTSLARMSRSRRGGDLAALIAVLGGSAVFAGLQLVRFVSPEQLEAAARVARWTPPGMAGEAFELASRGDALPALWRIAVLAAVVVVAGWWWARQLDRLLSESGDSRGGRLELDDRSTLAIFGGAVRRRLPHTASGAAAARELIYLVRSPGRRAAMLGVTVLGLVYVAFFVAQGGSSTTVVMAAPVAMLFALQYASNQLGVDPGAFWLEVSVGPPGWARWVGRQMLGVLAVLLPVTVAATILAAWTGGWTEFGVVMVTMVGASLSMVGVGSFLSPMLVTPVPDSGNPFGGRQAMSGTGCSAAVVGMLYLVLVGVVVVPPEFALRWAWRYQPVWLTILIGAATIGLNLALWWVATVTAVRQLPDRELEVLIRLDPRLNV
ncbi:MAG: hypothetical protein U0Q22_03330 [Acidimicrobiales bacterium]